MISPLDHTQIASTWKFLSIFPLIKVKLRVVVHACNPSNLVGGDGEDQPWARTQYPVWRIIKAKKGWVWCLPSRGKVLSSNPVLLKKKVSQTDT
jgi:hypothetical protein